VYLMSALERVRAADPVGGARLELHLAGVLSEADRAAAGTGATMIREHGYLPHAKTTALMRSADLLFLPMHDLPEGQRSRIVPGKTYEYLAAGSPILAAVPDGDARDILAGMENVHLCRPRAVDCMASAIAAELQRGEPAAGRASSALAPYERRALTRRLAGVFDLAADAAAPALSPPAGRRVATRSA
jgi:glycosyltransferase involved in cell wall biosynthesis